MTPEKQLEQLERTLWKAETRFDRAYMEKVLADDFFEFGRSGRKWSRQEVLEYNKEEIRAELENLEVQIIDDNVALVTYTSKVQYNELEVSYRSSLWKKTETGWQLKFHQGTPIP